MSVQIIRTNDPLADPRVQKFRSSIGPRKVTEFLPRNPDPDERTLGAYSALITELSREWSHFEIKMQGRFASWLGMDRNCAAARKEEARLYGAPMTSAYVCQKCKRLFWHGHPDGGFREFGLIEEGEPIPAGVALSWLICAECEQKEPDKE